MDLPFCSRFGFDKLKAMSKDDDVETDDCLVQGTKKSVLKNLKIAIETFLALKQKGETLYF